MTSKITYQEIIDKFYEITIFDNFCALCTKSYSLAFALKNHPEMTDEDKMNSTRKELITLGAMADLQGKLLLESAKKYKSLIDQIENRP